MGSAALLNEVHHRGWALRFPRLRLFSVLSLCFFAASCGSRSEPSATVPATTPSLCHHDSDPLEPQSQMSSLAMVFHHNIRKGTNTVGLSRQSQHVCVLVPKCRCMLRSFPFLLPSCPGSTHYMSSRLLCVGFSVFPCRALGGFA